MSECLLCNFKAMNETLSFRCVFICFKYTKAHCLKKKKADLSAVFLF